jgi:hypothetical protein
LRSAWILYNKEDWGWFIVPLSEQDNEAEQDTNAVDRTLKVNEHDDDTEHSETAEGEMVIGEEGEANKMTPFLTPRKRKRSHQVEGTALITPASTDSSP